MWLASNKASKFSLSFQLESPAAAWLALAADSLLPGWPGWLPPLLPPSSVLLSGCSPHTCLDSGQHRPAQTGTPHHTTPHNFSRVLKLGPQIFFLVKIANTNFIFNLVNVFHQALFAAPNIFGKILFYQLLIFWLNFQLKFIIGKKFNAKESFWYQNIEIVPK